MKLLSPAGTKDAAQSELTRKILRTQEVDKLAHEANIKLAKAEADFALALARSKETWAKEVDEYRDVIKSLEIEVKALEERKQQALIPISMYKEEVDKTMLEAQEIVKRAKEKEEEVDDVQEKLEYKLTEVSDRESIISDEEKRLEVAKQGLQSQRETTQEGTKRLSKEMLSFHVKQKYEECLMDERKKELSLAEINFKAKVDKYQRDLEALKIWEKQLKDERGTLDREYARKK